jgi:hypothetical protein
LLSSCSCCRGYSRLGISLVVVAAAGYHCRRLPQLLRLLTAAVPQWLRLNFQPTRRELYADDSARGVHEQYYLVEWSMYCCLGWTMEVRGVLRGAWNVSVVSKRAGGQPDHVGCTRTVDAGGSR